MKTRPAATYNRAEAARGADAYAPATLSGKLYRFHNYRVLDAAGIQVGVVDWIWANEVTGQGAFIGINLSWLPGKARAIPAHGVRIDRENATLRVPFTAEQIKGVHRFPLGRALAAHHQAAVWEHYFGAPAAAPRLAYRLGVST